MWEQHLAERDVYTRLRMAGNSERRGLDSVAGRVFGDRIHLALAAARERMHGSAGALSCPAVGLGAPRYFVANCIFDDKIHWAFLVASGYTLYGSAGASPSLASHSPASYWSEVTSVAIPRRAVGSVSGESFWGFWGRSSL
jgi:hypothetical protein